jgi:hypothetical protein
MEGCMRKVLGAVATILFINFLFFTPSGAATEEMSHDDSAGIVVRPETPPADAYERFTGKVSREEIIDVDGKTRTACVVHLEPLELPDERIPVDELGQLMILHDDGMTFIPLEKLLGMIQPHLCILIDPGVGELL